MILFAQACVEETEISESEVSDPINLDSDISVEESAEIALDVAEEYGLENEAQERSIPRRWGDGICHPVENRLCEIDCSDRNPSQNCPQDCPSCGDGVCGPGENRRNCPQDCPPICGDGVCESGENCSQDCEGEICGPSERCCEPIGPGGRCLFCVPSNRGCP